jgi:two-component system, NtrC family, response regulator GlrR
MARLLLIDDEPAFLRALCGMLEGGPHTGVPVERAEGIEAALAAGGYDAVVTDLRMQGMDGWAVAGWLHANRPGTPVIAISGDTSGGPGDPTFDLVLSKPVRKATLLQAIEAVLPGEG